MIGQRTRLQEKKKKNGVGTERYRRQWYAVHLPDVEWVVYTSLAKLVYTCVWTAMIYSFG